MNNNWMMVKLIGGIYVLYEAYELIKSVVEKDPEGFEPPIAIAMAVVFIIIGGGFLLSCYRDYKKLKRMEKEVEAEAVSEEEAETIENIEAEEDVVEAESIEVEEELEEAGGIES